MNAKPEILVRFRVGALLKIKLNLTLLSIIHLEPSFSWSGHRVVTAKITGSNPVGSVNLIVVGLEASILNECGNRHSHILILYLPRYRTLKGHMFQIYSR